jgi:hypothetical protein
MLAAWAGVAETTLNKLHMPISDIGTAVRTKRA